MVRKLKKEAICMLKSCEQWIIYKEIGSGEFGTTVYRLSFSYVIAMFFFSDSSVTKEWNMGSNKRLDPDRILRQQTEIERKRDWIHPIEDSEIWRKIIHEKEMKRFYH
jgi:hypothetical protein